MCLGARALPVEPLCNCNRNFTISRVCIDLQHYQPIDLAFKEEVITLTPETLLEYGLVYQLICSDPSQVSNFGRKINLSLTQGFKLKKRNLQKPFSSAKLLNGLLMAMFFQPSIILIFILKIEDLHFCPLPYCKMRFAPNLLLNKLSIGELELSVETLKPTLKT